MKNFLIEDDTSLCKMIRQQLTKENYIVDACTSSKDGMIYALGPDNDYALAIIDRMLPEDISKRYPWGGYFQQDTFGELASHFFNPHPLFR